MFKTTAHAACGAHQKELYKAARTDYTEERETDADFHA